MVDLTPCVDDYLKHAGAIKSGTVPSAAVAVPATAAAATGDGDEEDEEGVEYKTRYVAPQCHCGTSLRDRPSTLDASAC